MEKSNMKMMLIGLVIAALAVGGVVFALNSDDDEEDTANNQTTQTTETQAEGLPFDLRLTNLAPLAQGEYEGWVVRGDDKTSFGRFNTNESGAVVGDLSLDGLQVQDGDTIAISIEPDNDPDPGPSETIILAGEVSGGSATLAFPVDVSGFSGQYILATPTTSTTDDETAGLWFTRTGSDTSLDIPVAPAGWAYEGWAVVDGQPLSSGLFTDPSQADLFDGYSGPGNAPNKPGEDFISDLPNGLEGPLDLRGATIVVSIEPFQDGADPTGPMPAQVKPLSDEVAADATDHTAYDLVVSTNSLPSGSVTL